MERKKLIIIIEKSFLSFGWGRRMLSMLRKISLKNGYEFLAINQASELPYVEGLKFVFVIGPDNQWMNSIIRELNNIGIRAIITSSDIMDARINPYEIFTNQTSSVKQSVEFFMKHNRKRIAMFGINQSDTSDLSKSNAFLKETAITSISASCGRDVDIFYFNNDISNCFESFKSKISQYDAVICANDLIGVYFINECGKLGVKIPEDMYVVGIGDLCIGRNVTPALTTFIDSALYHEAFCEILFTLNEMIHKYPDIDSLHLGLDTVMLCRESTGCCRHKNGAGKDKNKDKNKDKDKDKDKDDFCITDAELKIMNVNLSYIKDPKIRHLCWLNNVLTACDSIDQGIIARQMKEGSYIQIADEMFISVDTVKYRLKKIYKRFAVQNRYQLSQILRDNNLRFI